MQIDQIYATLGFTTGVQTIIGIVILGIVLSRAISDLENLYDIDTVRGIVLVPVLSILLAPLLYGMVLVSRYELLFVRLKCGVEKRAGVRRYAQRRIVMHAGLSLRRVEHLLRDHAGDVMRIQTKADIDHLLDDVKALESSASEE
ncbi:MAG TPA: hypothetical protein VM243_14650 [Phycisphaerae bacterium]|nr:hypothetical protein [Phycisphaerae bacterium]